MKIKAIKSRKKTEVVTFDSLNEFYEYITKTETNKTFERFQNMLSSQSKDYSFTKTRSFDEAVNLMKNGWDRMAKELTDKMNDIKVKSDKKQRKEFFDVAGFQCSVPRYLNSIPTSMINQKMIVKKQKVVSIIKSISYSSYTSANEIIEESVKALRIVQKIEEQGIRVNLFVQFAAEKSDYANCLKVKIKSANERLNVSKVAFPLVHPSMLRRLIFRYIETFPSFTEEFAYGYGHPINEDKAKNFLSKDEYFIPKILRKDIDEIRSLSDLM